MTTTFCRLLQLTVPDDVTDDEKQRYVAFAAFWAFGGTLSEESRTSFATWWSKTWPDVFPVNQGDIWSQYIDPETRSFVSWEQNLPKVPGVVDADQDCFVPTTATCQLAHIVTTLMGGGHSCLVVGELGCGKSELVRSCVDALSGDDVTGLPRVIINCHKRMRASDIWKRIEKKIEWRHSDFFTPPANKRLLCIIDDVSAPRCSGESSDANHLDEDVIL